MLQVVEINAIEHLEAIRLRWTSLLYETQAASFFHTLDWLKVYWQHFRRGQRLRVLLVHRRGTVLGILPLVMRETMTAAGNVNALVYPTITPNQFIGPIGPNPTATLMASLRHLSNRSPDWDILSLGEIGEHDHGRTANALDLAGFFPRESERTAVAKVSFEASWAAGRPSDFVLDAKRIDGLTFHRIRPLGDAYGDDRQLDGIVEACCALRPHPSSVEPSAALLRGIVTAASRRGMLDLNLLEWEGFLIAFSLNVHFDGALQQLCAGEAAASFEFEPASVLSLQMTRDSIVRKDRYIYTTASNQGFANLRATEQLPLVRYQYHRSRPLRHRLMRAAKWLTSPLKNV